MSSTRKNAANSTCRTRRRRRANSQAQFPGKLHNMMTYVEQHGLQSIVSWIRNGTGIMIHDPERLVEILALFFGHAKYRSFRRQLNMWHFQRISTGPERGGFMHPFFIKDRKNLCSFMSRNIDPNEFQPVPLSLNGMQLPSTNTTTLEDNNNRTATITPDEEETETKIRQRLLGIEEENEEEEQMGELFSDTATTSMIEEDTTRRERSTTSTTGQFLRHAQDPFFSTLPSCAALGDEEQDAKVDTPLLFFPVAAVERYRSVSFSPSSSDDDREDDIKFLPPATSAILVKKNLDRDPLAILIDRHCASPPCDGEQDTYYDPIGDFLMTIPTVLSEETLMVPGMTNPAGPETVQSIFDELSSELGLF